MGDWMWVEDVHVTSGKFGDGGHDVDLKRAEREGRSGARWKNDVADDLNRCEPWICGHQGAYWFEA